MKPDVAVPGVQEAPGWGSDIVAEMLRRLGIRYVSVNPGSSFRGLHYQHELRTVGAEIVDQAVQVDGSDRLAVGIMGDGEFLGAASAMWTAAHYQIPVLIVVANNRSYFTDEIQQELVAKARQRPVENRWIGQRIDDPPVDLAGLARDYGVAGEGPIRKASDLIAALERGLTAVANGKPYLVDVLIDPTRGASTDWLADA